MSIFLKDRVSFRLDKWVDLAKAGAKARVFGANYTGDAVTFDRMAFDNQQAAKSHLSQISRRIYSNQEAYVEGNIAVIATEGVQRLEAGRKIYPR